MWWKEREGITNIFIKQLFLMETYKNIGHKSSQSTTHRYVIHLPVHNIMEAERDRLRSHLNQLSKKKKLSWNEGGFMEPRYKWSAEMSIVSSKGTLVKRLEISNDIRYSVSIERCSICRYETNWKDFGIQ